MDILIVDDEVLARQRLLRMVEKIEGFSVVAEADNAEDALVAITQHDPDIVLLDIRMPGRDGLSLAQDIAELEDAPAVIFCTAFDQYALDAFGTNAVGYLLKPVKAEQLLQVLEKAQKLNKIQRVAAQKDNKPKSENQRTHITAKTRRGVELIPLDDVRYFLADHKYVTVYHRAGEHLLDETLKELEEEFGARFVRVHRNSLVSVKHIEALERNAQGQYQVRLADTELRPVISRRHVSDLKALLKMI
ncbi:LytR/AlgR family response regulator transcription factor [Cellvibrio fibrivorans]|uniref:Two-component system response regulator AlgR n=1 Tax=Cellvibrio fibrivorans TaxID=126350 RepID=A0ABU1UT94_9GAMM|nr:LytTR family DNA-binding domain-containing protein [Cellvibrio fibrivorans]MDR7088407.1 two-component system response regulator AlgR [Cellvibrio fibrivorans]